MRVISVRDGIMYYAVDDEDKINKVFMTKYDALKYVSKKREK